MKRKLYALLSDQGTAMAETVLTEKEFVDPAARLREERKAPDDAAIPLTWADVTDNDSCQAVFDDDEG